MSGVLGVGRVCEWGLLSFGSPKPWGWGRIGFEDLGPPFWDGEVSRGRACVRACDRNADKTGAVVATVGLSGLRTCGLPVLWARLGRANIKRIASALYVHCHHFDDTIL
jgi:hypothetical protein